MRESVLLVVGAVVAVVLQIVLAPNLVILGSMPDLVLVYVGIAAMLLRRDSVLVMAFFAGLVMDLVGTSTVGVCAGLYTLIAFLTSRAAGFFGNDTLGASLAISMGCFLLVEVLYAGFYILSVDVSVIEALGQRALPCALYDCAMGPYRAAYYVGRTCLRRQRLLTRRQLPRPFVFAKGVAWFTLSWPRLSLSSLQAWRFLFSLGPETSNRAAPCRNR